MLDALFNGVTGIYNTLTQIFSFIGKFIDNLVNAVTTMFYYSDYVKGLLAAFPAIHIITGTLAVALSIGLVLKIVNR